MENSANNQKIKRGFIQNTNKYHIKNDYEVPDLLRLCRAKPKL